MTPSGNDTLVMSRPETLSASSSPSRQLDAVIALLEDGKAQDIIVIDLQGKASFADYMVIASGSSQRQLDALAGRLDSELPYKITIEGKGASDWVLADAGDIIIHLFRPEARAFYALEKMWGSEI